MVPVSQRSQMQAAFRAEIDRGRKLVSDMRNMVNSERCTFFSRAAIPGRIASCERNLSVLAQADANLLRLQEVALSPGLAASDPPGVPVIFVRPSDVVGATSNIIGSIKQQLDMVAEFAENNIFQAAVSRLRDSLVEILSDMAGSAAGVAKDVIKDALEKGSKEGGVTVWIAAGVAALIASAYVWRAFK